MNEPSKGNLLVEALLKVPREFRRAMVVAVHLLMAATSTFLAFSLRFDGNIPAVMLKLCLGTLPWLLVARAGTFFLFRLDEGLWRYAGLWDLRRIALAVGTSTIVFFGFVHWGYGTNDYPRSIFLIDTGLLLIIAGAFRLTPRLYRDFNRTQGERRLLIVGAGDTGERVLREFQNDPLSMYDPIGFVDDNPIKVGQRIHGVPVLGTVDALAQIVEREGPHEILLAVSSAQSALLRRIVTVLGPFKIPISTAVTRTGITGEFASTEIKSVSIEDLLSRPPVGLDVERVRRLITGRRVLVTGAGGSIGSELSRQIAALQPESLVLLERYENGLFDVANSLNDAQHGDAAHSVVADITDVVRLNAIFAQYRPEIVFHAAAHKHVPLMELNPCEAVKNNVTGTRVLAEAAIRHGVEQFILISTDKAVNPTSVMGASKRVAELVLRMMMGRGRTRFVAVRFGNVLGSNGSVLLRFQQQVRTGGPVTVTDPEIKRYFMLIPEAVQLVLHAAAIGHGGDTLVLEMGEQIRVLDLARNVIRLSGRVPGEDIPIVFTGLRPGEKLYEELVGEGETVESAVVDKINRILTTSHEMEAFLKEHLGDLERTAAAGDVDSVLYLLSRVIPGYREREALPFAISSVA